MYKTNKEHDHDVKKFVILGCKVETSKFKRTWSWTN